MTDLKICEKCTLSNSYREDFPKSREERIEEVLKHISEVYDKPMSVKEFCDRWVAYPLAAKEYKRIFSMVLAAATGIAEYEVMNWWSGKKLPGYLPRLLTLCDIAKTLQAVGICRVEPKQPFNAQPHSINLPHQFPRPRFTWNDAVVVDGKAGRIKLMGYEDRSWWYTVKFENGDRETVAESAIGVW